MGDQDCPACEIRHDWADNCRDIVSRYAICTGRDGCAARNCDDDAGLLIICRDIPGDHIGGPDCFCCPVTVSADLTTDQIMDIMQAAQRVQ